MLRPSKANEQRQIRSCLPLHSGPCPDGARAGHPAFHPGILDNVIVEGRTDWLRPLVVAMAVAVLFTECGSCQVCVFTAVENTCRPHVQQFFRILLKLPLTFYTSVTAGK